MTPDDKRAIEAAATNAGMTTSEYVRACTLMMMVLDLDPHAVRALGRRFHACGPPKTEETGWLDRMG